MQDSFHGVDDWRWWDRRDRGDLFFPLEKIHLNFPASKLPLEAGPSRPNHFFTRFNFGLDSPKGQSRNLRPTNLSLGSRLPPPFPSTLPFKPSSSCTLPSLGARQSPHPYLKYTPPFPVDDISSSISQDQRYLGTNHPALISENRNTSDLSATC